MSDAPALDHDHTAHPPAEKDVVPSLRLVLIGVLALAVFFVGSLFTGLAMAAIRQSVNPSGQAALPEAAGRAKIGIVEQRLFEHANQGLAFREEAERRLNSTGWVDRQKGIVHIPIDRAMDMVVKGARP
ncbi:MAG TPA: hypothetical protein VLV17_06605 [Anaeromyxobacteraceae bacterium]|nr:hypothetical protein [Anaeromyxobacteraceae bacterium]